MGEPSAPLGTGLFLARLVLQPPVDHPMLIVEKLKFFTKTLLDQNGIQRPRQGCPFGVG